PFVQQDEIGLSGPSKLERLSAGVGSEDGIAVRTENALNRTGRPLLAICNEYHRWTLLRLSQGHVIGNWVGTGAVVRVRLRILGFIACNPMQESCVFARTHVKPCTTATSAVFRGPCPCRSGARV